MASQNAPEKRQAQACIGAVHLPTPVAPQPPAMVCARNVQPGQAATKVR